jgi:hypothetical protein
MKAYANSRQNQFHYFRMGRLMKLYDSEIRKLIDRQALHPNGRMVSISLSKSAGAIAHDASLPLFVITPHCQRMRSRSWWGGILLRGRYPSVAVRGCRVM